MEISAELNNARLQAVADFLARGTGKATVDLMTAPQPEFGDEPTMVLATIELTEPVGVVSGGALNISATPEAMAIGTGTVAWARVRNGEGVLAWDCEVSDTAGSAPIRMPTTQLFAGGFVRISIGTIG